MVVCKCTKEEELNSMHTKIDTMATKVDLIYKELMGNGSPGLLKKWWVLEGSINTWKWIAGSGGVVSFAVLVITVIKLAV